MSKRRKQQTEHHPEEDLAKVRTQTLRLVADLEGSLAELQQVLSEREHREPAQSSTLNGVLNGYERKGNKDRGQ